MSQAISVTWNFLRQAQSILSMRVVGAAGVPPRSPSADRSTHVPAAGSVGLGGSDGRPLPKHSCLN